MESNDGDCPSQGSFYTIVTQLSPRLLTQFVTNDPTTSITFLLSQASMVVQVMNPKLEPTREHEQLEKPLSGTVMSSKPYDTIELYRTGINVDCSKGIWALRVVLTSYGMVLIRDKVSKKVQ